MWKNFNLNQGNYFECTIKLGKVNLWLTATENRWTIEIGDSSIIAAGITSSVEEAKKQAMIHAKQILILSQIEIDALIAESLNNFISGDS